MADQTGPLEQVYDAEISPLMTQIIAICQRAGVPFYASFALDADLACTSRFLPGLNKVPEANRENFARFRAAHVQAGRAIHATPTPALNLTVRDGGGNITRMETIL